jgi:tripartite-type tricarboxylate transporter receptor subunit TctC
MLKPWIHRIAVLALTMGAFALAAGDAGAQSYPSRPITFLVPYGPGTGNDVIARIVAQKVMENWGHLIVVENRPGAAGSIALEATARAAPDGYTIVIASTSQIVFQHASKVRYDMGRDYASISLPGSLPYVVAVSSASPARSLKELVAMAKAAPGKLNYAGQIGGVPQFMGEMLKAAGGIDIAMVPYKSSTDAESDVVAGRVEILFTTLATAVTLAKGGKIRVLGIGGNKRAAVLPDAPTMAEAGFPALDASVDFFILAPAATPKPIVAALSSEIVKAIGAKDVRDKLAAAGVEPKGSGQEETDALLKSEVARWGKIVKDSGVRVE